MHIRVDDLTGPEIRALLRDHIADAYAHSPPDSVFALGIDALLAPDIVVWTIWNGEMLLGCAALKTLSPTHGEIKSMRTSGHALGQGIGSQMLTHIIAQAKQRGYLKLSLETGSNQAYAPARNLYSKFGFKHCGPFADYKENAFSVFMTRSL